MADEGAAPVSGAWKFLTNGIADVAGHDKSTGAPRLDALDLRDAFGPELTAALIQAPIDLGTTRLMGTVANALLGIGSFGYAALGAKNPQMKKDMLELSAHFFNRTLVTRPEDIAAIMGNLQQLRSAVAQGSTQGVRAALIRTPDEVTSIVRSLQTQSASLFGTQSVTQRAPQPPPRPYVPPPSNVPIAPVVTSPPSTVSVTPPKVPSILV